MKKVKGKGDGMLLAGGILEALVAAFAVALIALYLAKATPEFFAQLQITPEAGVGALFNFYGMALVDVLAVIAAFAARANHKASMFALVMGIALIGLSYVATDWTQIGFLQIALNTLPGALIAGGALANHRQLAQAD